MKRTLLISVLLFAGLAGTAGAQLRGMPVWNDPNGGTGIVLSGEAGFPEPDGFGTVYAARGTFGIGALNVGATLGVHDPDDAENVSSFGGTAAYRLFGGSMLPLALNVQGGFSTEDAALGRYTRGTAAVGLGIKAPLPGLDLSAWLSPGMRFLNRPSGEEGSDSETDSNFGWAAGASLGLGIFGIHAGIDHENTAGDRTETTYGVGLHLGLKAPAGM
jgi:hypothetical protein